MNAAASTSDLTQYVMSESNCDDGVVMASDRIKYGSYWTGKNENQIQSTASDLADVIDTSGGI